MKCRNTLMVVLTLSLLLTACSSKSVKLLDQATEQYASGEYSLARENALTIINEYSDSEEMDAANAYAGLKVHPDRASWCIADGEMVHRHR